MELEKQEVTGNALLIESNKLYQKIMMTFLHQLNYKVDLVYKEKEAIKIALDKEYDLIVSDIDNKTRAQDQIISLIHESKNIGTPVIAWSELIDEKNNNLFVHWGADEGLPKPCTIDQLKKAIDECSMYERHDRTYRIKRENLKKQWEENKGSVNLFEALSPLLTEQLEILADSIEVLIEYKKWEHLLKAATITENPKL